MPEICVPSITTIIVVKRSEVKVRVVTSIITSMIEAVIVEICISPPAPPEC